MQPVIHCKYDKLMKARDVAKIFNPRNPNSHSPEQLKEIKSVLEYQGIREAFRINKATGFLNVGHGRTMAGMEENWDIPVVFQEYENEAQAYADMVADNALASWAVLDLGKIRTDLVEFGPEFDIGLLGIMNFELDPQMSEVKNTGAELNLDSFDNFQHECPKCGFEWNDNGTT